jgi:hypothetical protein
MKNISDKSCGDNHYIHFMFNNFFSFENRAVYELVRKNIVELGRAHGNMAHAHFMLIT